MNIAVIGAGLTGLMVARGLRDHEVTVFEKSRGVGGRMATRYAEPFEFDHGAQFFTARSTEFRTFLAPLVADGIVATWNAAFAELDRDRVVAERDWHDGLPHYVPVPRMNAFGKHLAAGLDVRLGHRIARVRKHPRGWRLAKADGSTAGVFDWVIVTAPSGQTAELLPDSFGYLESIRNIRMSACFAVMLGFAERLRLPWQAALVQNADVSWISIDGSKPGRPPAFSLLAHATNAWSDAHVDDDSNAVRRHLLDELDAILGPDMKAPAHCSVHRWRYANVAKQAGPPAFVDAERRLAAGGDWCVHGRVEGAYTSATQLLKKLAEVL